MRITKELSDILNNTDKQEIETLISFYTRATNTLNISATRIRGFIQEKLKYGKHVWYRLESNFTVPSDDYKMFIVYESNAYKIFLDFNHKELHLNEDGLKEFYHKAGYHTCIPEGKLNFEHVVSEKYQGMMETIWRTVKIDNLRLEE